MQGWSIRLVNTAGAVWRVRESSICERCRGHIRAALARCCAIILPYYRLIKNKSESLSICYSRKMAKTDYIMNGRVREGERSGEGEEG